MDNTFLQTVEGKPLLILYSAAVAAAILLLLGFHISSRRRRRPFPPGPKGLPLIGSMGLMDQLTHRGLAHLAHKYGGLFHMRMGFLHMITVSSPDAARQVLQVHDNIFSNRPATIAIRYLTYDRADMAFAHYGPFWRQMRKLCVINLFSRKRAESWQSVRDEVDRIVHIMEASSGSPVNIGELVFTLTKNVIYRAAFGSDSNDGRDEFIAILQEFSKLFGAFNWADFIPWLGWADPNGLNSRLVKARRAPDGFIDTIIEHHLEDNCKAAEERDMVDELLAFYSDGDGKVADSDDLQTAITLTKDNIKAIIMDVMFGGTETVASAIEWAMAELMKNPEVMKRAQEELWEVVGQRRVEETDLEKLSFFRCVIKETLRLHPPIPVLLHETAEEAVVMGYRVPAKARVMINAWAIGRDKGSWPDPDAFKPERFLKEGEGGVPDFKDASFEFIPFGSGRRSCPGMQLGFYALEMTVANLVHCFRWELPGGMEPTELSMDDVFGLTAPRASRLVAVPTPRLMMTGI